PYIVIQAQFVDAFLKLIPAWTASATAQSPTTAKKAKKAPNKYLNIKDILTTLAKNPRTNSYFPRSSRARSAIAFHEG
ncbi:MAG: hypothetical protein WBG27_01885, partial [Candidatus Aquilonibacter sp.]